ncbi:polysaccharide deacetylase family protein [Deferribacter thermophilus]|uniref:polysaccharide deacetylase family protein n=1 Tax=Deferribacter thermophilus TaxID=53573 RepID=UPI003C22D911
MRIFILFLIYYFFTPILVNPKVINRLDNNRYIAFTFDACETKTPAYFDEKILVYIIKNKIPVTIFVNKKFANRNIKRLKEISSLKFIEIENHSTNHHLYMQRLDNDTIVREVLENKKFLLEKLGIDTKFFRFPGFNYDSRSLKVVENLGYKVVHANLISGDPDKNLNPERIVKYISANIKGGDIIIFHINGRGYNTYKTFPKIYEFIKRKGFIPALLRDVID